MLLAALDQIARGGSDGPRFLFPLLLIILLGLLAAKLIRHRRGGSPGAHRMHGESPLRTLEDRFARGTIDRAEFDHRKAVLLGDDVIPPAPAEPMTPPSPPEDAPDPVTDDE